MGNGSSTPRGPDECTHDIYVKYQWTPGEIAYHVQRRLVTPIYHPATERSTASRCMCSICMLFYPAINETACCNHAICSECLAAIVTKPAHKRICPFCRHENYNIKTDVTWETLVHAETGKIQDHADIDSDKPDDFNALLMQCPGLNASVAWDMYQAGIPVEDIVADFTQ